MPEQRSWNLKRKDFVKWHLNHVLECIDAIVDVGGMRYAILIPLSCNVRMCGVWQTRISGRKIE